jgi:hypothetical protein
MKKTFLFLFLLFTSLSNIEAKENNSFIYTYEEIVNNKKSLSKWIFKKGLRDIKINTEDNSIKILYSPFFITKKYSYISKDENIDFSISLKKDKLIIFKNGKFKKKYKIKDFWIQQFSFGLKPFILSKKSKLRFSLVSPKDLSLQKMVAIKKTRENLQIDDKKYKTQKIVVTLQGFKKIFWKAHLWFDIKNGDFLKYQGNSGPKTPIVTTFLKSKNLIE